MPMIHANDIDLHYWQLGDGPDMVLIHGLTGNLASWHFTVVPELRQRYRLTTYDLRGHGRSAMPASGYTTRDMAEDLRGLLDGLGIRRAHLLGHSLGADIALHFALLYPERVGRIVAVEAGLAALAQQRKAASWPGWAEWARGLAEYGGIEVPPERWHDIDYMLRASLEVPIVFGPGRGLPRKKERILQLLDTTSLVRDYEDSAGLTLAALGRIAQRVLLLYGARSHYLASYHALRATLPNVQADLIADSQHFAVIERPAALLAHMRGFFADEALQTREYGT